MIKSVYDQYVETLHHELVPAMGCTEPIAIAYAASLARKILGYLPDKIEISVSGNILKNVKSVVVPNTGGMRGIIASAAAGIVAGNAEKQLEVLAEITPDQFDKIHHFIHTAEFIVKQANNNCIFDIQIKASNGEHSAGIRITEQHTNVVYIEHDGKIIFDKNSPNTKSEEHNVSPFTVAEIVEFADTVELCDVQQVIERQIEYNSAIAKEGLKNNYGANVGKILLSAFGRDTHNLAKATAAAGSDARMNGCNLPVVIVSGSGNQGMTASLPVIVYAKELNCTKEMLLRALVVSNLITIHLKYGIGRLSAYCGAVSAGCGAGAGICYLYGGKADEISHTIVNALAIDSGIICDGAKSSCAAKIASAVEAGLLGMEMYKNGSQFYGGDGIIEKGVENTINNVCDIARNGMRETDEEIIRLMIKNLQ